MAKKSLMSKEECLTALRKQGNDLTALRMYTGALRDGKAPDYIISDVLAGSNPEYIERWTLYRATSATGGALVREQFVKGKLDALAWDVTYVQDVDAHGCPYRIAALREMHEAQRRALVNEAQQ